jgi:hypothetical protein
VGCQGHDTKWDYYCRMSGAGGTRLDMRNVHLARADEMPAALMGLADGIAVEEDRRSSGVTFS